MLRSTEREEKSLGTGSGIFSSSFYICSDLDESCVWYTIKMLENCMYIFSRATSAENTGRAECALHSGSGSHTILWNLKRLNDV